jgi:3,4-dihydroxyphenylacetate 2,3-dioxygenase
MSLELGLLAAHVPRICHEEKVGAFQQPLIKGLHAASEMIMNVKPDVIVQISCHFTATFHHYVNATPRHKGVLTAVECPDLVADVAYDYPGDSELGNELTAAGKAEGLPIVSVDDPTYIWDYGTLVPLRYLVPKSNIPIIDLSVCWAASLDETYQWGQIIGRVLRESNKRVVFVSSGALSHNLVRGPEIMPTRSEQALDKQFMEYLMDGDYTSAREMLAQYAKIAGVEAGGRHLAMLLGVMGDECKTTLLGYAQSSGSANAVMPFEPIHA